MDEVVGTAAPTDSLRGMGLGAVMSAAVAAVWVYRRLGMFGRLLSALISALPDMVTRDH